MIMPENLHNRFFHRNNFYKQNLNQIASHCLPVLTLVCRWHRRRLELIRTRESKDSTKALLNRFGVQKKTVNQTSSTNSFLTLVTGQKHKGLLKDVPRALKNHRCKFKRLLLSFTPQLNMQIVRKDASMLTWEHF
jgi:hypothetical protein